ncbi:MFS transporter [Sphingomonas sp.]|uniref:MFS transporter n=1 Tax=Sphingomonas sp. TaxID=28214 RepID=UPI0025F795A3|nr:MFS transporter [Sphingomonas sp.]
MHAPAPSPAAAPHPSAEPAERRSLGFLIAVALAYAGGTIGFLPLLSLLLPMKIEAMAGDGRIALFSATAIAGATCASLSNILFGWLTDRSVARGGGRRGWMAAGIVATAASYVLVAAVTSPAGIVIAIALFQCAVNLLLAPLLAIMADEIPDSQKGIAGGLLSVASPLASAVAAGVVSAGLPDEASRLAVVAGAMAACTLPLVLLRARPLPPPPEAPAEAQVLRRDLLIAWIARLLLQIAGSVLSLYLLYYFESVVPGAPPLELAARVSHILMLAFIVPLPIAVLAGRLSDRVGRRKPFLFGAAGIAAAGLVMMAFARDWPAGAIGFGAWAIGSQVFLVLHATFAMQLLPSARHRGRDLGLVNLTNTLPALIGLTLTWSLATPHDFGVLMLTLAAISLCAGATVLAIRGRR